MLKYSFGTKSIDHYSNSVVDEARSRTFLEVIGVNKIIERESELKL